MNHKNVKGIAALVVVVILAFAVIIGTKQLSRGNNEDSKADNNQEMIKELDVNGYDSIQNAKQIMGDDGNTTGYIVNVMSKGYGGEIAMEVTFDEKGSAITKLIILEQSETEGLGSKITEEEFLNQFKNVKAPIALAGMKSEDIRTNTEVGDLQDGTYTAKGEPYEGYTDTVTMTVAEGKVTSVFWDAIGEDGVGKRVLSESGNYTMTEDGKTWSEQAEALANAFIENQSLEFLKVDESGKTDAVAGVSISIYGFLNSVQSCLEQAAGVTVDDADTAETKIEDVNRSESQVDGISGATVSSKAVVEGVNKAFDFVQSITEK